MNRPAVFWSGDHERSEGDQRRRQDSSSLVHLLHGEGKDKRIELSRAFEHKVGFCWREEPRHGELSCHSPIFLLSFQFKDQVVREAVEKICREFSGQCCIHKPLGGGAGAGVGGGPGGRGEAVGGAETQQVPEVSSSTLPGAPSSSTPPCSSCRGQTAGGGYQCRYVVSAAEWLVALTLD